MVDATTTTMSAKDIKVLKVSSIGSSIGLLTGLGYAFNKKKGFWAYVGYGLLGTIAIGTATSLGASMIIKD